MRRKDKEIIDQDIIEKILKEAEVIRIGMIDGDEPYLVAMNYAYDNGFIFMHSAKEGRKINIIKDNNKVCFQADIGVELLLKDVACDCATKYMSVFGTGRAYLVDEKAQKINALNLIMDKYAKNIDLNYPDGVLGKTIIIKVKVDSITGKKSGY